MQLIDESQLDIVNDDGTGNKIININRLLITDFDLKRLISFLFADKEYVDSLLDLSDYVKDETGFIHHWQMFAEQLMMYVIIAGDDRYTKDVGIDADYMQKTYQFFMADRGKGTKQQDYTPASIAKLTALLAQCPSNGVIYDLCSGSGALTIAAHEIDSSLSFVCEELDENVIPILLFNLAIRNINAIVLHNIFLTPVSVRFFCRGGYSEHLPLRCHLQMNRGR